MALQKLRHYFYDDETLFVYYSEPMDEIPEIPSLIYVGSSFNLKPKNALAFFMRKGKVKSGYKLKGLLP